MLNTEKMNKLLHEAESLWRDHASASAVKTNLTKIAGEAAFNGDLAQARQLKEQFDEANFTIRYVCERLEEVKTELVRMVNSLSLTE
jgi:hypothetical protein